MNKIIQFFQKKEKRETNFKFISFYKNFFFSFQFKIFVNFSIEIN